MVAMLERPTPPPLLVDRAGEQWVRCPLCNAEGRAWQWSFQRPPLPHPSTVPVYRCKPPKGCGHVFALAPSPTD